MISHISACRGRSPPFTQNLLHQTLLVHGYQTLCIKPFWFMGIKPFVSNPFGSWVSNLLYQTFGSWVSNLWFMGIKPFVSNLWFMGIKPFWFMGIKPFVWKPLVHGHQTLLVHGYQKISQKKGRYKNGWSKKIKILKYFDDGLQNKNKKVWDYKGTTSSLKYGIIRELVVPLP